MEQTLEQTITIVYSGGDGILANTGTSLTTIAAFAGLLILAVALVLFMRRPQHRYRLAAHGRRGFLAFMALSIVLSTGSPSVMAAPVLGIENGQTNLNVTVPEGGGTATASTTLSVDTASSAGYTLSAELTDPEPGIALSLMGGAVTEPTALTAGDAPLELRQTSAPATDDTTELSLSFALDDTVSAGTKQLKLVYRVVDNTVPVVLDAMTCRNADSTSSCQVDIDAAMIPIAYSGDTTTPEWRKANLSQTGDWYNYQAKQWANAVAVSSASLASYQAAPAGTVIDEADVLAYYVYVPRYEYQVCRPNASDPVSGITAAGCPSDITTPYDFAVQFQLPTQKTAFDGTTAGDWATHPAFTFGSTELAGIWVGKYETSSSDAVTSAITASAAVTNGTVRIKPNQNGLSYQNLSTQFDLSQSFADTGAPNYQNLNPATTDTRMMRDADWGSVAYLATSSYGKGAANPVYINNCYKANNDNARTGWSAPTESASNTTACVVGSNDTGAYHTTVGRQASTTGNPTGIYDMSGGNFEYTLGNFNTQQSIYGNYDGFASPANFPAAQYLDIYPNPPFSGDYFTNNNTCTWATCGGHALHETKSVGSVSTVDQSWGSDYSFFVDAYEPWFFRGGVSSSDSSAGLFSTYNVDGDFYRYVGFRAVQTRL